MRTIIQQLEDLKEWAQNPERYERRLAFRSNLPSTEAGTIPPEFDELSDREVEYYKTGPWSTREDYRKGQLVQPGPGRQGYEGTDTLLEAGEKETNKIIKQAINKKIYESKEFKTFFKDELKEISKIKDTSEKSWKLKDRLREFSIHKKRMTQLPGGGKGYITLSELVEKLDIPEHVFESGRHRSIKANLPSHDYKFISQLLSEQGIKSGKATFYYYKLPKLRDVKKIKTFFDADFMLPQTVKAVNILNKSQKLSNMLKVNDFPDIDIVKEILKNNKLPASDANAATAMSRLAQIYQGQKFKNKLDIEPNKVRGNFITKSLDAFDSYSDWGKGRYEAVANQVTKHMPDKAGNLTQFKRAFNYNAGKLGLNFEKMNLNLNELFSIKGSLTNKAYPYAYFVDVIDADLNQKALKNFHGNLSKAQIRLRNTISDLRAGKKGVTYDDVVKITNTFNNQTRKKFANTIKKNYPGKKFNLAKIVAGSEDAILNKDFKIPTSVYSKKNLDKWAHLGADVSGHAKTAGYVMTGADKPTVRLISEFFTPESSLKGKKVMVASTLNKFLEANGVDICNV